MDQPRTHLSLYFALALLSFLFATNVYRAATQSVTIDEAFTYHTHIAAPEFWKFANYTANNHVLNTLAAKLTTALFGPSDFTLRLPSLAGGLLYFAGLWRLARIVFGSSPWFPLFVAACSLNPFILDFLSVARGYGMGLGFFLWGAAYLLEGRAWPAGAALGLAAASQLTYAVPAAAAAGVFLVSHGPRRAFRLAAVGGSTAAAILIWPMRHARPEHFYVGEASLWQTVRMLGETSLFYKPTLLNGHRPAVDWVAALVAASCAAALVAALYSRNRKLLAACGLLFGSVALLCLTRLFVDRPFPAGRTALYFYPLVSLVLLAAVAQTRSAAIRNAGAAVACLVVLQYALEFQVSFYWVYRADAGVKKIFLAMESAESQVPARPLEAKAGATWELADSLDFYRITRKAHWMRPVTREGPDCFFDYYVLAEKDANLAGKYSLRELYRDPLTGARLSRPGPEALERLAAVFPPPVASAPPCRSDPENLPPFARMSEAAAARHIVQDVAAGPPDGDARWTYARPILLFRSGARYVMRIRLTSGLFPPGSGPLEIAVSVNGRRLAARSFTATGDYTFEAEVPAAFTRGYDLAAVELNSSRHFTPPGDNAVLGFQLLEAGFETGTGL